MTDPTQTPPFSWVTPTSHPESEHVRGWHAHVAATRSTRPPVAPEIRANLLATDALFRDRARWFRHAERTGWERNA